MPPREWFIRLEDILEAIERVETSLAGLTYDEFERNEDKKDAAIRNFTVIGEAANHIPEEVQNKFPQIPWSKAVELRNFVVHEYFGITLYTIWDTAKNRLPELKTAISAIVAQGGESFQSIVVTKRKPKVKQRRGAKKRVQTGLETGNKWVTNRMRGE